jgi:hypothetical protein
MPGRRSGRNRPEASPIGDRPGLQGRVGQRFVSVHSNALTDRTWVLITESPGLRVVGVSRGTQHGSRHAAAARQELAEPSRPSSRYAWGVSTLAPLRQYCHRCSGMMTEPSAC